MNWGPGRNTAAQSGGDTSRSYKPPACELAEPLKKRVRGCGTMPEMRRHSGPGILSFGRGEIGRETAACETADRNGGPKPASNRHTGRKQAQGEMKTRE